MICTSIYIAIIWIFSMHNIKPINAIAIQHLGFVSVKRITNATLNVTNFKRWSWNQILINLSSCSEEDFPCAEAPLEIDVILVVSVGAGFIQRHWILDAGKWWSINQDTNCINLDQPNHSRHILRSKHTCGQSNQWTHFWRSNKLTTSTSWSLVERLWFVICSKDKI